jgi:hypothetical protein
MGREEEIKTRLFQSAIEYVRKNHQEAIDKAYEYFWDEQNPDEFLTGTPLEIGFINFEDWLIFDCKAKDKKETFLEVYAGEHGLSGEDMEVVSKVKDSVLSLYEVASVSRDKRVLLKDLLLGDECSLRNKTLTRGLNKGDLFATRIFNLDGNQVMSVCVYPFRQDQKKQVLDYVEKQFKRYIKNANPEGTMRQYLKEYGDVFNLIWLNFVTKPDKTYTR